MQKGENEIVIDFEDYAELKEGTALSVTVRTDKGGSCTSVRLEGPLTVSAGTKISLICSGPDHNRCNSIECVDCAKHLEYLGKEDNGDDANRVYRCTRCEKQIVSAERLM